MTPFPRDRVGAEPDRAMPPAVIPTPGSRLQKRELPMIRPETRSIIAKAPRDSIAPSK